MMDRKTILEKQTNLSKEKLMAEVKSAGGCLFINELAVIFLKGDEEVGKFLCELLRESDLLPEEVYPVYMGLSSCLSPTEKILQVLDEFRSDPKNKDIVEIAKGNIKTIRDLLSRPE
jgi:hypothetical protein